MSRRWAALRHLNDLGWARGGGRWRVFHPDEIRREAFWLGWRGYVASILPATWARAWVRQYVEGRRGR
jgi:hypothetical protein